MPRAPSDAQFSPPAHFAHTLLPARDWQDRPEFAKLCDWWRGSSNAELGMRNAESIKTVPRSALHAPHSTGVCALVGIGGAGKTAIAERFLRVLPSGLPAPEGMAKDDTLLAPRSLFVLSFYDAPNPDSFFAEVSAWLGGFHEPCSSRREEAHSSHSGSQGLLTSAATAQGNAAHVSYQQTLRLLESVGTRSTASHTSPGENRDRVESVPTVLLILDGLEKVQDDGARGGAFGQLLDGRLRDLILRAADGYLPGVALLITTRFRLFDPLAQRSAFYCQIDIDQLQPPAALALLRARGVRATDAQLLALAQESGFHALTLDLLGGYVAAFCDGDPLRLPPLAEVKVPDEAAAEDPRLAAVKEQERKFGRLAQRYRETLAARDPVALALMERVCLFRLGVDADTLAAIFTGAGKETVSGPALAALDREQVANTLRWLAQMRLLDETKPPSTPASKSAQTSPNYKVHPAVREGFLLHLGSGMAMESHEAARHFLTAQLSGIPSNRFPPDPSLLDLLEEIVYHTIRAGRSSEALEIYENRIGGFLSLGMAHAEYERGQRICASLVAAFDRGDQYRTQLAHAKHDLGLYKQALGSLGDAYDLLLTSRRLLLQTAGTVTSAIHHLMHEEAHVLKLRGRLWSALAVTEEIARESDWDMWRAGYDPSSWVRLMQQRAELAGLIGRTREALDLLRKVEAYAGRGGWDYLQRFSGGDPHAATRLMSLIGASAKAESLALECLRRVEQLKIPPTLTEIPRFQLALAELARARGILAEAHRYQDQAHEWAIARDAKEVLSWSALVRARIQVAESREQRSEVGDQTREAGRESLLTEAGKSLDEGLRIARDCGYGIYHIDLLLERARLHLLRGEPQPALDDIRVALDDGVHPPADSGFPTLLAATDPECGYAWGIAEGRHLRAQAFLLQAAQILSRPDFAPADYKALPAEVRSLIESARKELAQCRDLRKRIHDPKVHDTEQVLKDLDGGALTQFLLVRSPPAVTETSAEQATDTFERARTTTTMQPPSKFDVFLSHNSKDKPAVRDLKQRLTAQGLTVWFDEDELQPGIPWQQLLEAGIKSSASAAVLVGKDGLGPWEDEEMQAALRLAVKDKRPVIPVLLPGAPSQPELPLFLGNRTWVDLRGGFTEEGIAKLVWGITGRKPNPK